MAENDVQLPQQNPVLRVVPMPADLNQNGDVFGGWVMAQVDVAGAITRCSDVVLLHRAYQTPRYFFHYHSNP